MNAENRYITDAYGLVADMLTVEAKDGFRLRIPVCDLPLYLADGYRIVPKCEQLTNATSPA